MTKEEEKYTTLDTEQCKWWVNNLFGMAKEQACNSHNFDDAEEMQSAQDKIIKSLEIVEEFERAQIITGGRLNGRTYAYKCGLEDGKRKALEQQPSDCVSRADARHLIAESFRKNLLGITFNKMFETLYKGINDLPPVTPTQRWIPVSERLPKDRDWYLGIFREHDTGWINPLPFVCDYVGKETKATTKEFWILHGFTDKDNPCDYYKNLECVAWQPLPKTI